MGGADLKSHISVDGLDPMGRGAVFHEIRSDRALVGQIDHGDTLRFGETHGRVDAIFRGEPGVEFARRMGDDEHLLVG